MSTRRITGIVAGVAGVAISVGHIVMALVDDKPERYHGHEVIVLIGFALALAGLLLIGTDKQR